MAISNQQNIQNKKAFNIDEIRSNFPCLNQNINGKRLAFLDTAASAQKPESVIKAIEKVYRAEYANIHRGLYSLSEISTSNFEETRKVIANFINAESEKEIIFTRNATEGINLVAYSYGQKNLKAGDEIIISEMEHHANIVPWQELCKHTGAILRIVKINEDGDIDLSFYKKALNAKTKIVALSYMSNVLGTINPVSEIIHETRKFNPEIKILLDACQAIVHLKINVQNLDCDFLVFSGHKLYGPNSVGILYGKYEILDQMTPYQTGGEMIENVSFLNTSFAKPPLKFEAGTPAISEVIAFKEAIFYLEQFDTKEIHNHETEIFTYAYEEISKLNNYTILGKPKKRAALISFNHKTAHPNDLGMILNNHGVAIRSGHLCAQPLMELLNITATARASFGIYTNKQDIDQLIEGLKKVDLLFRD